MQPTDPLNDAAPPTASRAQELIGSDGIRSLSPIELANCRGYIGWLIVGIAAQAGLAGAMWIWAEPGQAMYVTIWMSLGITACAVVLIVTLAAIAKCKRLLRSEQLPADQRAWLNGYLQHLPRSFDAGLFIDQTGPNGPRVVEVFCLATSAPTYNPPADEFPDREPSFVTQVSEEHDIEAVRRPSIGRQLWSYSWLLWAVPALLAQCLVPTIPPPSPLRIAVLPSLLILIAAAHLVNANVGIFRRFVLATPGRVEVSKFGRTVTFTRADSVLMIHPGAFGRPAATLLQRDGTHCQMQFVRTTQHGFLALLARWSYPALTSATAAQTPAPS